MPVRWAALVLVTVVFPLTAQKPRDRPWQITVSVSGGWGGPAQDMVDHLVASGGYESQNCGLFEPAECPAMNAPGAQWSVALGRRLTERIGVLATVSTGELGWAWGYGDSGSVSRSWSSTAVAALVTLDLPPLGSIGAGPLLARLDSDVSSFGLQLEADLRSSARGWGFGRIFVSYRWLPPITEGPYPKEIGQGELSAFEASYSLLTFGIGVGLRFGS